MNVSISIQVNMGVRISMTMNMNVNVSLSVNLTERISMNMSECKHECMNLIVNPYKNMSVNQCDQVWRFCAKLAIFKVLWLHNKSYWCMA